MSNPLAFDANKQLKKQVDTLMTAVGTNGLCIPLASSYHQIVQIVNAMVGPVAAMKSQIENALNNNKVMDALGDVSKTLDVINSGLGQIDPSTLKALDIFSKICLDFRDILPASMQKMLNQYEDFAMDFINDEVSGAFDFVLPTDIDDMMTSAEDFFKDGALSDGLSDITSAILSPITMYRNFISSCGIIPMIKRLQKFERCMTNPNTCNRPNKEFWFPKTKKYNSQYYLDMLCVNLKGEVLLNKINRDFKTFEGKMNKTLKKMDEFTKKPIRTT